MVLPNLSRRRFLKKLGAGVTLYAAMPNLVFAGISSEQSSRAFNLSFVDQAGKGPYLDAPFVEENFIPLHKEMNLPAMDKTSDEYFNAENVLKTEFQNMNVPWSDDFQLSWSYQHYGVPDNKTNSEHIIKYCQTVHDYLYQEINGLEDVNFTWSSLSKDTNVLNRSGNYALAGKHTYFVLRVNALDKEGNIQEPYLVNAQPVNRALHYINAHDDEEYLSQRLIYVIRGATSLVSPFSEMLHMSTHNPAMRYADELKQNYQYDIAKSLARSSGETVTESAAVLMALDYLYSLGKQSRANQIIHHAQSLESQLPEFSHSIAYMQKYGVQNALNSYHESPARYMKAIAKM